MCSCVYEEGTERRVYMRGKRCFRINYTFVRRRALRARDVAYFTFYKLLWEMLRSSSSLFHFETVVDRGPFVPYTFRVN